MRHAKQISSLWLAQESKLISPETEIEANGCKVPISIRPQITVPVRLLLPLLPLAGVVSQRLLFVVSGSSVLSVHP